MGLQKLLIADSNEDFLLAMAQALQTRCHVLCCRDGKQALELLRRENCDMIVLDLLLPELDGITLLEIAASEGIRPIILAATPLLNEYVFQSAQRLSIRYLVRKPCDVRAIAARVEDLSRDLPEPPLKPDDRQFVSGILLSLGLSAKHDGYDYLLECVLSMAKKPGQAFTKELYPAVGRLFGHKGTHVERSIRNALDVAWLHHDHALWQQYFPCGSKRPTVAVVITHLANALRENRE